MKTERMIETDIIGLAFITALLFIFIVTLLLYNFPVPINWNDERRPTKRTPPRALTHCSHTSSETRGTRHANRALGDAFGSSRHTLS